MDYNKDSFLAGISVGRTLKGWAGLGSGGSGGDITWQDITVTPEAYEVKVNAPEGFGIRSVTIPAEEDYVAENILLGADLWGLKGTHRAGMQLPAEYMNYLTEAILLCAAYYSEFMDSAYVKGGHNFFLAENDEYITIGFVPATGMTITEYNPATTEFSSYGWVGYRYEKDTEERTTQDYRLAESPGGNFGRNIKYATFYIEYEGVTLFPVGIGYIPKPMAYLYNGVQLPPLPKWDKEKYPYAILRYYSWPAGSAAAGVTEADLVLSTSRPEYRRSGNNIVISPGMRKYYFCVFDDEDAALVSSASGINCIANTWTFEGDAVVEGNINSYDADDVFWSNTDIIDVFDNTVYFEASDPVPVYE